MNEVVEVIKGAREILSTPERWYKQGGKSDGCCVMEAVAVAAGLRPHQHWERRIHPVLDAVRGLLTDHLPRPTTVWEYNDYEDTTHADILNLLDKVLAGLGGLA